MKNPKVSLRNKADNLWSKAYLKERCEVCGSDYCLQAHHFYYKSSSGHLRYTKENHITLCRRCHFVLHSQDPKKIEDIIIDKRGEKWHNELREKSKETHSSYTTIGWYRENIELLKQKPPQ